MPYADRQRQLEYQREYSIRRNRRKGMAPLGSPEHREKVSAAIREHWKTREPIDQGAEKNPNWRGDLAGWSAVHKWLRRNAPKTGACQECGKKGKTDWAYLRHTGPFQDETYSRNLADYLELCRSCHIRRDRDARNG